jgi:Sulfatase-modifying factor enzyme 1
MMMVREVLGSAILLVMGIAASSCGSDSTGDSGSTTNCSPGKQESCACPSGQDGVQRCVDDGSGWEPCQCPDGGAAGTGGIAGASGSGGGTAGTSQGGSAGASVDPSGDCPKNLAGPELIEVSTPGGKKYCIDATEVTGGHYRTFRDAKKYDMTGQPPGCEGNTAYDDAWTQDNFPTESQPAFNIDWCDAYMYCQWAGKHLCGAVGGGVITSMDDMNDPEKSEWYNACSSGGAYSYPYGNGYDPKGCNTYDYAGIVGRPRDVPAVLTCHGPDAPFDSVFDMCGNVSEWVNWSEDSRRGFVGGAYNLQPMTCAPQPTSPGKWDTTSVNRGFRCCAETAK